MSSTPDEKVVHPSVFTVADVEMEEMTFRFSRDQEPMTFYGKILWRSPDGTHVLGVEKITPQDAEHAPENPGLPFNQFDHFFEGRVTIEAEGEPPRETGKGNMLVSPVGTKSTWTVHETMVKAFMMFSDEPIDDEVIFGSD